MSAAIPSASCTLAATVAREFLSYRINRFLYVHLGLMLAIGILALLAPPEAAAHGTAWWVLNGVLFVASLSAIFFGLSSAQAEADEFPMLFTQPLRAGCWVAGKATGLLCAVAPAAMLLVAPTFIASGWSNLLLGAVAAAAGVSVLLAWIGLALGLWIQDPVRGVIAALGAWCLLLVGTDLLLIVIGGADWIQAHPAPWVAMLMASPLDAYRITLLLVVERAAFSGAELEPLARWWLEHPAAWLAICLGLWWVLAGGIAVAGAKRRRTYQ